MQCSHVIQTQAQKCDGMHIDFDAVYQEDNKFARETSKTQTELILSEERTRHFDVLTHNLFFCTYSGLQNTLKYIVIPPNSNTFPDWRRTCHVPLVKTQWRPRANKT